MSSNTAIHVFPSQFISESSLRLEKLGQNIKR